MLWCVLCIFSSHRPSDALYSSHRLLSLSHFSSVASRHRLCQYMKHRAQCASSSTYRQRDSALGTSARTRQSSQSSTSQTRRVMTRRDQSQVTLICHPQTLQRFQHSSPVSSFPLSLRLNTERETSISPPPCVSWRNTRTVLPRARRGPLRTPLTLIKAPRQYISKRHNDASAIF